MAARKHQPVVVDLFAGAGGLSLGLERAGFRAIGAFEWNQAAGETYQRNLGEHLLVSGFGPRNGDISRLNAPSMARQLEFHGYRLGSMRHPGDVDLVAAGPPCQGFSRVGRGKLNSLAGCVDAFTHDPRNQLYRRALEVVEAIRPKAVLLENVPGILHLQGTNMAEVISGALDRLGYEVRYTVLNAAWYGVPQTRERVFILGLHRGMEGRRAPVFPEIHHEVKAPRGGMTSSDLNGEGWDHYLPLSTLSAKAARLSPPVTVAMALSDLPPFTRHLEHVDRWGTVVLDGYRSRRELFPPVHCNPGRPTSYQQLMRAWLPGPRPHQVTDHFCRWVPRDFATFKRMKPGDNYLQALRVAEARFRQARRAHSGGMLQRAPSRCDFVPPYSADGFHEKWKKLHPDLPSWTLTAHLGKDTYSHIHYDSSQARAITPREAARLQSFPDGFVFFGNAGDMYRQIGNAVPPLLAMALGRCILRQLQN